MTDKAKVKSYLKQYFGTKRYLYQNGRKVAHMHIVNDVYLLHGHFKTKFTGLKLEFGNKREFYDYLKEHELHFEESQQLTLFEV
ncbi:SAV1978 family virulence-associated passenger protein [Staphylococcus intermedius]|uniref:SAV1978 family virulence-associated passenger protein n=1 Tax=Staphylococcus intermedius TaxID=1285 RepID=UPI000BBBB35E|nr:SAV1978 family virulence-associated passenger protein [Staphylococcus intermedius]PCF84614.1 hypothetical protein B4W76_11160 [Staphylococcus intermedius]PCF88621.1 hypothetical protein B4W75_07580 [Staphylococcus intermedius]